MADRTWPYYPQAFLHDVARFLALTNQSELALTPQGRLEMGSVSRLAGELETRRGA